MFVFARTGSTGARTLLVYVDGRVVTGDINSVADPHHLIHITLMRIPFTLMRIRIRILILKIDQRFDESSEK
jgi:hypothetical protein